MKTVIKALILLSTVPFASAAVAAEAPLHVEQRVVKYADLDITHPAGAEVLHRRIASAANRVCLLEFERYLELSQQGRQCVSDAITRAVNDVNAPLLTAYHRSKARGAGTVASSVAQAGTKSDIAMDGMVH